MNDFNPTSDNSLLVDVESSQPQIVDSGLPKQSLFADSSEARSPLDSGILRFEAEALTLTNYNIESNDFSSGGQHISLVGSDLEQPGIAAGVFNGPTGTYEVRVGFYDESDGISSADILVAGQTQSFLLDEDLPAARDAAETFTTRTTHSELELAAGDTFEIQTRGQRGEFARFDYIEFVAVDETTNNAGGGEAPVDTGGETLEPPGDTGDGGMDMPGDMDSTSTGGPASDALLPAEQQALVESTRVESFVPTGTGETYYVSPTGSDDNPGTQAQPWKTIGYATSEASAVGAGDTVLVQEGTYTEIVDLEKSGSAQEGHIHLKADGDVILIDPDPNNTGGAAWHEGIIQSVGQSYWVVDGFRIEDSSFAGISLRDADNMVVQNNHTFETGGSGIIVMPDSYFGGGEEEVTSSNITVLNNTLEKANNKWAGRGDPRGVQEALSIWGVDGFDVAGNFVNGGTREGIDVKTGSRNGSVRSNVVTGVASVSGTPGGYQGGPAIYVEGNRADTFNVDVYDNVVYGNVADGIVVADEVPEQGDVRDVRVFNNVVYDNGVQGMTQGAGIAVTSNVSDVEVINNTVSGNVQAIVIEGSDYTRGAKTSDVTVRNNIFADSTFRNGLVEDVDNLVLDNNLFTDGFDQTYAGGTGLDNLVETNNTQVSDVGFADAAGKDYRLTADSAAVDAGVAVPNDVTADKDGNARQVGEAVDLGAFEFGSQAPPAAPDGDSGNKTPNPHPPDTAKTVRYEAEDLELSGYKIELNADSSSGKVASLRDSRDRAGSITGIFEGASGTYQVQVGYHDESDGVSSATITVDGAAQSFMFDKNLPDAAPSSTTLTEQVTHQAIELKQGDQFKLEGIKNYGEYARFDYIEFIAVNENPNDGAGGEAPVDAGGDTPGNGGAPTGGEAPDDAGDDAGNETPEPPIDTDDGGLDTPGALGAVPDAPKGGPTSDALLPAEQQTLVASTRVEAFVPAGTGETYYVSPNGSDGNPGTQAQPWKTIGFATSEASAVGAGDTILVQEGTYTEIVDLEKSGSAQDGHIHLKADGDVTLLDPDPNNTSGQFWHEGVIESIRQEYWVIDGFRIENSSFAGISLRNSSNMIVQNNHTFETGGSGIIAMPDDYFGGGEEEVTSSNITVINNTIEKANNKWAGRGDPRGVQEALSIWGVDGFEVAGNFVNGGTREGIDVKTGSRNGAVRSNVVTGTASVSGTRGGYQGGPAIYIEGNRADTFNVDVYENVVYGNVADGIVVADEVPEQGDVRDVRVFNNVVYGNGVQGLNQGAGIAVNSNVSDVEVTNNTVSGNVQSLVIDGTDYTRGAKTSDVTVRNNIFANDSFRGGLIEDVDNLVLDNNVFVSEFEQPYQKGSGLSNLVSTNNTQVESAGFQDEASNNYRLTSDSVAVDAGVDVPDYVAADKDGNARQVGEAVDLGAFEFSS